VCVFWWAASYAGHGVPITHNIPCIFSWSMHCRYSGGSYEPFLFWVSAIAWIAGVLIEKTHKT